MVVRGAPAIGVAAAYGTAVAARGGRDHFHEACDGLAAARPTAVNLAWAIQQMREAAAGGRRRAARPAPRAGGSRAAPAGGGPLRRHRRSRRRPARNRRARAHPLQRRRPRHRRLRHRAGRDPQRPRPRPLPAGVGGRDAPAAAGRPADGLGAGAGRNRRHAAGGLDGRLGDGAGPGGRGGGGRRPHRPQRRHREQDRNICVVGAGSGAPGAVLRGRSHLDHRPVGRRRQPPSPSSTATRASWPARPRPKVSRSTIPRST